MKKSTFLVISVITFLFLSPKSSFADVNTTINVSNNGANSKNTVDVENNTGGNTVQGQSSSKVHTSIRIDTNGNVKTYESDKPEDVNIQSDNGNVKVNIKNSGNSVSNNSKDIENKTNGKKASIEARIKTQTPRFNLGQFVEMKLNFLRSIFNFKFF